MFDSPIPVAHVEDSPDLIRGDELLLVHFQQTFLTRAEHIDSVVENRALHEYFRRVGEQQETVAIKPSLPINQFPYGNARTLSRRF